MHQQFSFASPSLDQGEALHFLLVARCYARNCRIKQSGTACVLHDTEVSNRRDGDGARVSAYETARRFSTMQLRGLFI